MVKGAWERTEDSDQVGSSLNCGKKTKSAREERAERLPFSLPLEYSGAGTEDKIEQMNPNPSLPKASSVRRPRGGESEMIDENYHSKDDPGSVVRSADWVISKKGHALEDGWGLERKEAWERIELLDQVGSSLRRGKKP